MNNGNGVNFIKNIIIVIFVLTAAFLSQQPYVRPISRNLYLQGNKYWAEAESWLETNIYLRAGREGAKSGHFAQLIKQEIIKQKNNFAENIWEKIKNYLAEKFSKFSGTKVE